ncbi:tryptophan synthase subunit alpha [Orrella marina]|uniref:Tryptophan synthase alpha chain n=1 Tax=Orrella marina TaxID=2163011 RepID=A0A2R4XJ22_9BURK|nr:tryptophan synthase subunit alpha [Orrella marina]AWB33801.1 tryptophan synthase subunit alpha [Orrella marina]
MTIQRITDALDQAKAQNRAALIPYIAAGNPLADSTVKLMHELVKAGSDVIELGVPFSDPMADGPIIQKAAEHAIAQGVGLPQILEMVAAFRKDDVVTPVVLMGYANPVERMGQQAFVDRAAASGVDGVLIVDYPPEEVEQFGQMLDKAQIAPIFLLAPTSTQERVAAVGKVARGYVYYVSLRGITGAANIDTEDVARQVRRIREHVSIPIGVGFGISDEVSASRVARVADAVVIGSKLISVMNQACEGLESAKQTDAAVKAGHDWLAGIRRAIEQVDKRSAEQTA